jgi:hypothetical protein
LRVSRVRYCLSQRADAVIVLVMECSVNCFGRMPPPVEGTLLPAWNPCRAPTVRQQGTLHRGLPLCKR